MLRGRSVCAETHLRAHAHIFLSPSVLEALVFFFSASLRQPLSERIVMLQVDRRNSKSEGDANIPTGSGWEGTGTLRFEFKSLNSAHMKTFYIVEKKRSNN